MPQTQTRSGLRAPYPRDAAATFARAITRTAATASGDAAMRAATSVAHAVDCCHQGLFDIEAVGDGDGPVG